MNNMTDTTMIRNVPVDMESLGVKLPPHLKGKSGIKGFAQTHEFSHYVPKLNDKYVFAPELRKDVLMWIDKPLDTSLWLSGPTGCGKTSIIEQLAARFNWGVMKVTASPDMDMSSLLGSFRLKVDKLTGDQETVFHEGPLTVAYKHGLIFLLDEYDQLEPSVANALNGILELGTLLIPETNEAIHHHENFRFVATANSNGGGDATGMLHGVKNQNIANLDRFMFVEAGYMNPDDEYELLISYCSDKDKYNLVVSLLITLSNEVRQGEYNVTISTRCLVNIMKRFNLLVKAPKPAKEILLELFKLYISNRAPSYERIALIDMFNIHFGADL